MRPRLLIFDDLRGNFGPLTDLRAAFDIRTGRINNRVRIESALGVMAMDLVVDPALAAVRREHETDALVNAPLRRPSPIPFNIWEPPPGSGPGTTAPLGTFAGKVWKRVESPGDGDVMLVNGRWTAINADEVASVAALPLGQAILDAQGQLVAAHLRVDAAQTLVDRRFNADGLPIAHRFAAAMLTHPWDIIASLEATLRHDLLFDRDPLFAGAPGVHVVEGHTIRVAPDARVHPMVVLNAEKGPIHIDRGAIVGSFCVIAGPCVIGRNTIVGPHSHIRANTSVGANCVVAGEVSHSVVHDCSNKSHAGYLGHSVLGSWVNLGADTTVSNLKNTYGSIRVQLAPDAPAIDSRQTKLGPVIGDFVRTAIGSRILTGSCIGTGAMLGGSGFAPKCVAPFTFLTDESAERYDADKFIATAKTVMSRRKIALTPAMEARIRDLISKTR